MSAALVVKSVTFCVPVAVAVISTLLMAVTYLLTPDLLHAGNLLSAIFLLITCVLAIHLTRSDLSAYGLAAIALGTGLLKPSISVMRSTCKLGNPCVRTAKPACNGCKA